MAAEPFFLLDADTVQVSHYDARAIAELRSNARLWADPSTTWTEHDKKTSVGASSGASSYLVRLWCRTASGRSACVVIADPVSTMYRRLASTGRDAQFTLLATELENILQPKGLGALGARVCVVRRISTNGWTPDAADPRQPAQVPWMKMSVCSAALKASIHSSCLLACRRTSLTHLVCPYTGERNVEVHSEAMLESGLRPGRWFRLKASSASPALAPAVCCDMVVQVRVRDLEAVPLSDCPACGVPPIRVLSFDIECYSDTGDFPDADKVSNPIITIGLYSETLFGSDSEVRAVALCLEETSESPTGAYVTESFSSEADLLTSFGRHMRLSDADVVVGYNTSLFDWNYISRRVATLTRAGVLDKLAADEIFRMSRVRQMVTAPHDMPVTSSAMGDNPLHLPRMPGRFEIDLWFHLKRANSTDLPNLKLNTVAEYYLKDTKHDLPPAQIFSQYRDGGRDGRALVAAYCVQDTKLVLDLVKKLDVVQGVVQMAAVTQVTPQDINFRGQQIRVYTQILRKARDLGYVVEDTEAPKLDDQSSSYAGAHVVEPKVGHYTDPVLTLDFASLYPSIMRTWNLSFDTLVRPSDAPCPTDSCQIPNTGHTFVRASVRRGLLPLILDELLAERKKVREQMKSCTDPLQLSLLNGMQLTLKISANSCYGFTGSLRGLLVCREVAEATTGAGRDIINATSAALEQNWPGSEVVYGDTDSCFVRLPEASRSLSPQEIFDLGEAMASAVTRMFSERTTENSYIDLEMEKFFQPLVLYKKKRYAGLCFKDPRKPPAMTAAGIEMVRRDSAPALRRAQKEVLERLVVANDVDGAVLVAKNEVEKVLATPAGGPFADLAQSKTLRSKYSKEESMSHVRVAKLMEERQHGSAPRSGERLAFVVVASTCARVVDKVDDVQYAEENRLPPDWVHYVEMLTGPLLRLLEVPLQSLAPHKLAELLSFFDDAKRRAGGMVMAQCVARQGTRWLPGHMTKTGTQLRLTSLPGFEESPAGASFATAKKRRKAPASSASSGSGPLDLWLNQSGSNPSSSSTSPPSGSAAVGSSSGASSM